MQYRGGSKEISIVNRLLRGDNGHNIDVKEGESWPDSIWGENKR